MVEAATNHTISVEAVALPRGSDDAVLVARAKQDRQAFTDLYFRYVERIYRYCYHRLGSREAAEDATADIFVKALAALPTCRDDGFPAWLFAIAHNVITDRYRTQPRTEPLARVPDLPDETPTPEDQAIAATDRETLRALLAQLTEDQRQILELRLAGLTDAEIGRVLNRSRGAVRAAQFRGITRLRKLLGIKRRETHDVAN